MLREHRTEHTSIVGNEEDQHTSAQDRVMAHWIGLDEQNKS